MTTRKLQIRLTRLMLTGWCALSASSCIPRIVNKGTQVKLPDHYQATSPEPSASASPSGDNLRAERQNAGTTSWKTLFSDPQLVALINTALKNNQEVKIAAQSINLANNEIHERKGEYKPFFKFFASAELDKVSRYTRKGAVEAKLDIRPEVEFPEPLPNSALGFAASWEWDIWNRLHQAKDVAVFEYMASVEGKKFVVTNLVAEIASLYYELMALDNKLKNMQDTIQIQQRVLGIIRKLKEAARANELAVKRFEAEVKKNQSELYALKQEIVRTENQLNFLLGRNPQPIERPSDTFKSLAPKVLASGVPTQLLENRPDIKQAEHELEAADLNVQVAKAQFYPTFEVNGGLGLQSFDSRYLIRPESINYALSLDMSMPFFNRNALEAAYKNANARQIQAVNEYERTILNAYKEVSNQLSNMANLAKNYQLKSEQVNALNQSIEISDQLFKYARADYMEVLLTQREALEAQLDLIETKQAQMQTVIHLYRALGGGWR